MVAVNIFFFFCNNSLDLSSLGLVNLLGVFTEAIDQGPVGSPNVLRTSGAPVQMP